jgi:hypothetical protein
MPSNTFYLTDGKTAQSPDVTVAGTTTDGAGAPVALGTRATGNDGTVWVYAQAGSAIGKYFAVAISGSFQATLLNITNANLGYEIGFAQAAFADNDFGWFALAGSGSNLGIKVRSSCAAGVPLYTDVSASGFLDDSATATQALIEGVVILTLQSSSTVQSFVTAGAEVGATAVVSLARNR